MPFLTYPLQGDFNALPIKVERMRRVCFVDFLAHRDLQSEHFIRYPFLENLYCFLNLSTAANEQRDAIADAETKFLPHVLNATDHFARRALEAKLVRYHRFERRKIATFLFDHQLA